MQTAKAMCNPVQPVQAVHYHLQNRPPFILQGEKVKRREPKKISVPAHSPSLFFYTNVLDLRPFVLGVGVSTLGFCRLLGC